MKTSHRLSAAALAVVTSAVLTSCGTSGDPGAGSQAAPADGPVTLSFMIGSDQSIQDTAKALIAAFTKANPTIKITTEVSPGGSEGDNLVKTRLATGEMTDVFWYNSGSLLQALNPAQTMVDLTGDPVLAQVQPDYLPVVTQGGKVYGVPAAAAAGGGILYNRKVYERLGLQVPKTWAEFMANNEKIKAAGITPVVTTFKDTWTSQLLVLADYYNIHAAHPSFAADFTAGKAKFATTPAATAGFQHLADIHAKDFVNKGFGSATVDQGLGLLAEGKGAHYPMLTAILPPVLATRPNAATDVGFFGVPGDDAAKHGATVWEPPAIYIARTTEHLDAAKKFLAFVASPAAADAVNAAVQPTGPFRVKGAKLPGNALQVAKDLQVYIDNQATAPALEFLSPVKGPSLEQITVAVGTGLTPPAEGAAQYDKDVEKQAKQLGLPGW
ncbi:ABC transporter substrate-binding protein [Nonomuraea soli]|uniref:Raffinose/stachyose/melibiose transport system substrate-binding protein n=1 Tax=Nonomuraea soli TaxID=1032476 RepID=A0A7W0CFU3_9ACTN|nr:ABC transporter substrate-binding protein [Nonomuraea soli]MBA2890195.1 raffinose/stachyose/melibiose transport system substrate-binding protein [Nonomuraea soli]